MLFISSESDLMTNVGMYYKAVGFYSDVCEHRRTAKSGVFW